MARTSLVHYIAPSAISITPNCNSSVSDLAVYVARGTKIKVNSKKAGIDTAGGSYQEWVLTGRNRRLADSTVPYTIYARLRKTDKTDGYLMFVPQQQVSGEWKDKYPYVTIDGLYRDVYGSESRDYYYVRLGDVTLPGADGREVILDTGILGTEQYNEEWNLNPDNLPMRVELNCTISDEDAGPTPYVFWGETLQLVASLIKGWSDIESPSLDHWEITRDSGDATADAAWPGSARAEQFASTGVINLLHSRTSDDFNGAVNATFTVNAWGYPDTDSSGTPQLQILQSASICIMAETLETFELISSTEIVSYNPQTQEYSPEGGVAINIRATDQRSDVFDMSTAQVTTCRLAASYAVVGDNTWTALTFSDVSGIATATIPISAFALQQSVNIRLLNGDGKEVSRKTIAFVRDGEDSKEREWIFLRSATPITFGDASSEHPKPSLISGGEVNPTGAAGGEDTNKNQDGWVPEGWWDEQRGTEESVPYEYGSYRNFIHATGDGSGSGDSPDGHWGDFTDPTIWSHFGKDGNGIVSITKTYAISAQATTANDNTAPSDITKWSTGSPATTPAKPYLWAKEVTVYTDTTKNTTKYYRIGSRGDNGIDAQDVEWVYIRTKTTTAPVIADDSAYTDHNGHTYAADDHLPRVVAEAGNTDIESNNSGDAEHPFECTDSPKGTDDTWKYEWEIKRTKGNADTTTHKRSWNTYSGTMILRTDPAFNRYINTILGGATGSATTVATAQNAVLSALNSRIYQQGGLMLASLIAMRKLKQGGDPDQLSGYDTWGGISGQYDADARGYGIASWYGGDMIDYESLTEPEKAAGWGSGTDQQRWARSLFRFDGSGYLSNGNISWDAAGNATFKGTISAGTTITDYQYLKTALGGDTSGLVLANQIALKNGNTVMAGMSGAYSAQAPGGGIAAWYGGTKNDRENAPEGTDVSSYAKSIFRMDGTGYMAAGKISWNADGSGKVAGGNISWNADGDVTIQGTVVNATTKIDTPAIFLNGTDITSTLNAILDMFEKDTTTEPGTTLIKAKYSLYSVGDVSALGNSSGGGGGGGGASVLYELNDVLANAGGTSVLDAQAGYVLTCVENGGSLKWKAAPTAPTYVLPAATSGALGGIKIGFTEANKNYAVQLDNSGKAYVNVPWTDNDHHDWSDITNKPSTFTPSAHTHDYIVPKSAITYGANYLQYDDVYATEASNPANAIGNPTADWYHHIVMNHANAGGYFVDMALCFHSNDFYYRRIANGVASDWVRVLDSSNSSVSKSGSTLTVKINGSSESITDTNTWRPLGTGASDACAGNDSRLSDSRPASDVYSWAKQSTKPSYNLDEVSDGTTRKLSNYLLLSGDTLTGVLTLKGSQYAGYMTGSSRTYAMNANNSDIVGINALIMADKSDGWTESIGFPRDGSDAGHYDTFRAANGTFYFGFNGYFDSSNVEHAAAEVVTITGGAIQLARQDTNNANLRVKNTSRDISLDVGSTNCGVYYQTGSKWLIGTNGTDTWLSTGKVGIGTTSPASQLDVHGGSGVWSGYFQGGSNSGVYLAYADGNGMFVNSKSTSASTYLFFCGYGATQLGTAANTAFRVNCDGKVGVGVNPSYKFHVSGDIYATGDITAASDERQKCDIEQIDLSVEQIANAPAVKFSWKDGRDNLRHVGSFAQYWKKVLPESVTDKNDILGLNYGSAALVSVVKVAKKVLTHEEEIEQLKKRVRELEMKLNN